jgi:hypothetical protein
MQPPAGNRRDRARRGGQVGPNPVCLHPSPEAASTPSTPGSDDQSTLLSVAVLMALILIAVRPTPRAPSLTEARRHGSPAHGWGMDLQDGVDSRHRRRPVGLVGTLLHPATPTGDPEGVAHPIADSQLWSPITSPSSSA